MIGRLHGIKAVMKEKKLFLFISSFQLRIPPLIVIGCGQPRVPTNGYIEGSTFDVGNWVKFRCSKGYELAGTKKLYCRPGDGYTYKDYWSGAQPSCRRKLIII